MYHFILSEIIDSNMFLFNIIITQSNFILVSLPRVLIDVVGTVVLLQCITDMINEQESTTFSLSKLRESRTQLRFVQRWTAPLGFTWLTDKGTSGADMWSEMWGRSWNADLDLRERERPRRGVGAGGGLWMMKGVETPLSGSQRVPQCWSSELSLCSV